MTPRVAVIGAGIAGVSAAWELRRQLGPEANIMLVEAYDRIGGKLKTVNFAGGPVDMGAEAFLAFRRDFVELVEQVGLGHQLRAPSTEYTSSLYCRGQLVDVPAATVMGIPARGEDVQAVLPAEERRRIDEERGGEPMTWEPGQDAAVGQLVEARFGRAVVDRLVTPLLGGVYSCGADGLGVRSTIPQLAAALDRAGAGGAQFYLSDVVADLLAARTAGGARRSGPVFQALAGGFRSLLEQMVLQADPEILFNTAVESIGRSREGWYLEPIGTVDGVVLAAPAPTAAVLLRDVADTAAGILSDIELSSSVVVGMRFASDHGIPERSGVLLGPDAPTEAKAFTFSSRKWPHIAEHGGAFVRASYGTYDQPWYVELPDRALINFAVEDLEAITGERKRPEEYFVQRWHGGLPRYGVGYAEALKVAMDSVAAVPTFALAGAMVDGVGVPATAASGITAARRLAADLAPSARL
ncbi:protoporphyrinogen oxidase [Corynebacterium heidelbergense]|uniref:Coproporphyrinogen III oxidase n=1 Tax=Corynebacterium heidelbergense TaxID=2055947 RepID=A0A364V5F2_9CORY|nr:protoporphyrinogen oxidase [Corynebacterium heidelbergense]RAV31857.1 protoporphyrinogen oxidase [Corynebacterium heidelbergense]